VRLAVLIISRPQQEQHPTLPSRKIPGNTNHLEFGHPIFPKVRLMVDHHIPQENALIWGKNQIIMVVVWGECHYILCKRQTIII
jgi:hypothetical protein